MKIGEVVKRTGLTRRTIRFYTEKGLINPAVHENNGRDYRDYSEKDVQELLSIAQLRKALFSIEQIHRIKTAPEDIPEVLGDYYRKLKDAGERIATLIHTAQNLDRDAVTDMQSLSGAFEKAAKSMPLPEADRNPRFGRLDSPEFAESPEVQEFHENQYRERAQFLPPNIHLGKSVFYQPVYAYNLGTMTNKLIGAKSKRRSRNILIAAIVCIALLFGIAIYLTVVYRTPDLLIRRTVGEHDVYYSLSGYKDSLPEGYEYLASITNGDYRYQGNLYCFEARLENCPAYISAEADKLYVFTNGRYGNTDRDWLVFKRDVIRD